LAVLVVATALSVYKPLGLTTYGRRQEEGRRPSTPTRQDARWGRYVLLTLFGLVLLAVIVHLAGGGLHHHSTGGGKQIPGLCESFYGMVDRSRSIPPVSQELLRPS